MSLLDTSLWINKKNIVSNLNLFKGRYTNFHNFDVPNASNIYTIPLSNYNINNSSANATNTTKGINDAILYAKNNGYDGVKLPKGKYYIDTSVVNNTTIIVGEKTFVHGKKGICMQSDLELILEGCILEMIPTEDPYYSIVNTVNCDNAKITGGTIIGDKFTHNYGMRILGSNLKLASLDDSTGNEIESTTDVVTGFIEKFVKYDTKEEIELPTTMSLVPLWDTNQNSVYGSKKVYCYDSNNTFLGICTDKKMGEFTLLDNTKKIRIVIPNEAKDSFDFTKGVWALSQRTLWWTYEFATGIMFGCGDNLIVDGTTIKDCIGDCMCSMDLPIEKYTNNVKIINCDLSGSRRQGISFVASGENYLIENCKIHGINGIDPQFGIDIEHYNYVKNVVVNKCNFYNNRKGDLDNFNGTSGIEACNCTFTNGVVPTRRGGMIVHDCYFKEGSSLYYSYTDNNISYNNIFVNALYSIQKPTTISYNNRIESSKCYIGGADNIRNDRFSNCAVSIEAAEGLKINNVFFENCNIQEPYKKCNMQMNNVIFKNSNYRTFNKLTFNSCRIDMDNVNFLGGYKQEDGSQQSATFNNTFIKTTYETKTYLFYYSTLNMSFNDCIFDISRYPLIPEYSSDNTMNFSNCKFSFNNLNSDSTALQFDNSSSTWSFNKCHFKSTLPVRIHSANITNSTYEGNVTLN